MLIGTNYILNMATITKYANKFIVMIEINRGFIDNIVNPIVLC